MWSISISTLSTHSVPFSLLSFTTLLSASSHLHGPYLEFWLAHLVPEDEIVLVDLLEGEPLAGLLVLDEVDGAVRPVGYQLHHLKILLARRLSPEVLAGDGGSPARVLAVGPRQFSSSGLHETWRKVSLP